MKRFLLLISIFLMTFLQVSLYQPPTWNQESTLEDVLNQKLMFDFSFLNAAPGTSADKAKALYYYVAGPPTKGYPAGYTGPANGLFGLVGAILSHSSIELAFSKVGIQNCDLIPSSGSVSAKGHSEGDLTLSFFPGRVKIPTHFNVGAGTKFNKRIQIDKSNRHLISIEMNCELNSVTSGYMVMENGRRIELYYQFNRDTGAQQMDAYMDYSAALGNLYNEKVALRFENDDGQKFRFWAVRTTDDAIQGSLGIAVEGDTSQNHAKIAVVEDADATADTATNLDAGSASCVSLDSNTAVAGCPVISPAGNTVHGNNFNIVGTDAMEVDTIELLRGDLPSYEMGSHSVGSTHAQTVTLSNVGSFTAVGISASGLADPFSFAGGAYPGTNGTCGTILVAGETCTLVISFDPTVSGTFTDSLILSYSLNSLAYKTTLDVSAVGQSTGSAVLSISESEPYDFGSHATSTTTDHTFIVTNSGIVTAMSLSGAGLAAPYSFKGGAYPGAGGTCSSTLASAGTCNLVVSYSPTVAGVHNDTIDLNYNDGSAVQITSRDVTGTGTSVSVAVLTISESDPYDYGTVVVGDISSHIFMITNTGTATATSISEIGLVAPFNFSGGSYPGLSGTCTSTLAAGSNCNIEVSFAPTVSGVNTGAISLSYNDGSAAQMANRNITGTGANPVGLIISDGPTFDYGSNVTASSSDYIFTVTNSGGFTATSLSGAGLAAPYSFAGGAFPGASGTCGAVLASGASCTIQVNFSPTVTGVQNDTIEINYSDGVSAQISSRPVTGTGL